MHQMDIFNVNTRIEAKAPNLKPVLHNFNCCTEAYKVPKPKLCEGSTNCPALPQLHCLHTTASCPKHRSKPSELHERDILFRPIRWRCKESTKLAAKRNEPSLGAPIGLSKSSFSINFLEKDSSEQSLQAFATILIAFAEYFITPEIEWDEKVINRILLEGQSLYVDSKTELLDGEQLKETTIKRSFVLCKNAFNVLVNDAFLIGHMVGKEMPVPNLHWGLLKFFKNFQFCLLQIGNWYSLLWKTADVYFVFDCFGRRTQDFQSDRRQGVAMLICLRSLDNVSHLVVNLSGLQSDQIFTIRHLQVKSLIPCGGQAPPDIVDRSVQFEIISSDYALLRGTIHLGSQCFKEIRHRQSLPVAMCALINAKVDATPTWDSAVLDKIIKLGTQFYKQWTRCDVSLDLGIQDVPRRFSFGQFIIQIALDPISECGLWKCTPNYRHSELTVALKKAFGRGSNLLIQIQGRCYAIWKKREFYYVMDPYSHQCSLEKKKIVTASLRMCATIDRLCCIVTQALLELFEESTFLIHLVQILQVEELDKINDEKRRLAQIPCRCLATPQVDCSHEEVSLNESVRGPDDFECAAETSPVESDSADLDSPGLSQVHLEDYTDLRRHFMEESSEESEEEEEDDIDRDALSVDMPPSEKSDDDQDDDKPPNQSAPGKNRKKSKNSSGTEKKSNGAGATSEAKDSNRRGNKREHETADDDTDDEMDNTTEKESNKTKKQNKEDDSGGKTRKTTEDRSKDLDRKVDKEKKSELKPDKTTKQDEANENDKRTAEKDKRAGHGDSPTKDKEPDAIKEDLKINIDDAGKDNNGNKKDGNKSSPPIDQDAAAGDTGSKGDRPNDRQSKEPLPAAKTTSRRQRHQRRKEQDGDDTSSDENPRAGIPVGCKPNSYPGFTEDPQDLAVVGSENGSYDSLCSLLKSAFRCADRVLTMTPWGNYVTFHSNRVYFVFDGCTCNLRSIRHMDISVGTAGLLCFPDMHSLIRYIESGTETPRATMSSKRDIVNQICSEYCGRGNK